MTWFWKLLILNWLVVIAVVRAVDVGLAGEWLYVAPLLSSLFGGAVSTRWDMADEAAKLKRTKA